MPFCNLCTTEEYSFDCYAGNQNWRCPLLDNIEICDTCCAAGVRGGYGEKTALEEVFRRTGKTAKEIYPICSACKHGGADLKMPPQISGETG